VNPLAFSAVAVALLADFCVVFCGLMEASSRSCGCALLSEFGGPRRGAGAHAH
jgi:hypothetical protein